MVLRRKLQPESWVKSFQGRNKNQRSRSALYLLVLHMQYQASSSHLSHCLKISWLCVENCDQNCGSKVFGEEKKIGVCKALFNCQCSISDPKQVLATLYIVWEFHQKKTATRIVDQMFPRKKKKLALTKRFLIASAPYAIPSELQPRFTFSENFMVIREKLRPESWVKCFQERKKKLTFAKRSSIASASYAITSEVYPPFTLSGNFMFIRGKLRPESWVKSFQGRKKYGAREAHFDCQYSICNHKRGLPTLYIVWKFYGYTWKTATRIVGQRFSGQKKKLALAKRSLIASFPYAIPSEVYPPFTLSGNFMVICKKLRPESWVKGFQGRKKNWRSRSVL